MEDAAHRENNPREARTHPDAAAERPVGALSLDLLVRSLPPAERPGARRELTAELVRLYTRFGVEPPAWLAHEAGDSGAEP